jgi:hypothetical protein
MGKYSLGLRKSLHIKAQEKDNPSIDLYYTDSFPVLLAKQGLFFQQIKIQ